MALRADGPTRVPPVGPPTVAEAWRGWLLAGWLLRSSRNEMQIDEVDEDANPATPVRSSRAQGKRAKK